MLQEVVYRLEAELRLVNLLRVLPISEATYHYWKRCFNRTDKDQALKLIIQNICRENPHYGVRRVYLALRKVTTFKGVNHKKVQRLMHEMHLQGAGYRRISRRYDSSKGSEGKRVKIVYTS